MIDLYYWTTPNGHKITIFLEEAQMDYQVKPVNISRGEQFKPDFLKICPNNKIPAILDLNPNDNSDPIAIFESGAILQYLAEKTGRFLPPDLRERTETLKWLTWQVANLGPISGQNHYFLRYASEKIPKAIERYGNITKHLYEILNKQLDGKDFIIGREYSIADMAIYPWALSDKKDFDGMNAFPAITEWLQRIEERPAVKKAYAIADDINPQPQMDDNAKKVLFEH